MASSRPRRRVATVLFVDIVGSTALASELGDDGWRRVLARFRQVVRGELKRWRGREQDTAGDGFYATFAEPARALAAAAAIVSAVQAVGLDLRVGLHTGECEEVDGKLTGIAVHMGARVMSVAGAAEVLATRTTRDLVVGSEAQFEEAGTHELKGVEGEWLLYRLVSVPQRLPGPLEPEIAAERLAAIIEQRGRRTRRPLVAGVAVAVAAVAAVLAFAAFGRGSSAKTASLLRIDPASGKVTATVRDAQIGCSCGANLWANAGTLWEEGGSDGNTVAIRELSDGALRHTFHLPPDEKGFTFGDGSLWVVRSTYVESGAHKGPLSYVERLDVLSGRRTARIRLPGNYLQGSIAAGDGAVWVLQGGDSMLVRIDPATNRVTARIPTGAIETTDLIPVGRHLWICECIAHEVLRVDPQTGATKTFHYSQQPWQLVPVAGHGSPTLWLMDYKDATITRVNPATGGSGTSLGLAGKPTEAVLVDGSIWVAAGSVVDRVRLANGNRTVIQLPKGTNATGIAADPATGTIWVDNSRKPAA